MGWDAFVREVGEVMFKNAIVLPDQTPNQRLRLFLGYLPIIGPPSAWASLAEGGPPLLRHTSQTGGVLDESSSLLLLFFLWVRGEMR